MHEMMNYLIPKLNYFLPNQDPNSSRKYMVCDCGCNVFHRIATTPRKRYKCNACDATYTAWESEAEYQKYMNGDIDV